MSDDTLDRGPVQRDLGGCPVKHFLVSRDQPAGVYWQQSSATRGQLGYLFQYLAEHDDDRQRIIDDPALIPGCVEESLRLQAIILDMVMGLVAAANRDPRRYERPDEFIIDRTGATHFGFAAGPHRCLGAHLARREMQIAVEEWHKVIPHYRIATDQQLVERGGQLTLLSLPLAWDVPKTTGEETS